MRTNEVIVREYEELIKTLPQKISNSGYKTQFICDQIQMSYQTFQRRMKNPESFTIFEVKLLNRIL